MRSMERRGLIRRKPNPTDMRQYIVEPTRKGLAVFQNATPLVKETQARLCRGFTESERTEFIRLLSVFLHTLE
jgi:DNA-binding MarR family transcriptional regulator